jgi:thioredoxin-related protein
MGWYEGSTSSRMTTETTAKKVSVKLHYDAVKPAKRKYVLVVRSDGCYWCLCISL